jgi:serine/threonine protein kinase/tetratricopeptide (TPR) repeat protein
MIGKSLSHYQITSLIGKGGMGEVYQAKDTKLGRDVAIKLLPQEFAQDAGRVARFQREAKLLASLNHPNIAAIHGLEAVDGIHFLVMELIEGQTLAERINTGAIPVEESLKLALQIAEALEAAHEKGVIHRDLKPANIKVTPEGKVKVLDFGLAKALYTDKAVVDEFASTTNDFSLTRPGTTVGTVAYMSPEQARGEEVDARSDIFSFGVVLYEMATGIRPFAGATAALIFDAILNKDPVSIVLLNPGIPQGFDQIVQKALDKNPNRRYQSATELLVDLQRLPHAERVQPPTKRLRKLRIPILAAVLLLLLLLVPGTFSLFRAWLGLTPGGKEKIAIVLFTGTGDAAFSESLGTRISMDLASRLTQLKKFQDRVAVASSSEILNERITTARGARQLLGASLAITGNVNCQGHKVVITMYLENTRNLTQRDAMSVEGKLDAWNALRKDCLVKLAQMLQLELDSDDLKVFAAEANEPPMLASEAQIRLFMYRSDRLKDINSAIGLCEEAIVADPEYAPAYATLSEAFYRKHLLTPEKGLLDEGRRNAEKALQLDGSLPAAFVSRGLIYDATGEYERAISDFLQALRLEPTNVNGLLGLALVYNHENRLEDAEKTYHEAVKLHPNHWPCPNEFGIYLWGHGRYEEAVQQWQQMLKITPDNVWGYINLGAAQVRMERWDEAIDNLQIATRIAPDNIAALNNLGTVYLDLGRYEDAVEPYTKALEIDARNSVILGNLAKAYSELPGRSKEAYESFRHAAALVEEQLNENPRNATALSRLATYYGSLGERAKALEKIRQATAIAPRDVEVCLRAVLAYEIVGQREEALFWLGKALELNFPKDRIEAYADLSALVADPRYARIVQQHASEQ